MRFENQDVLLYSVLHLWLDYTNILTQNIVLSDHDHFTLCHVASESHLDQDKVRPEAAPIKKNRYLFSVVLSYYL